MNIKEQLRIDMGRRLKEQRQLLNLTQEEFAEILDMSLNYYGLIERGQNGLSLERLLLLYKKLDIDPTYLITGDKHSVEIDKLIIDCPRNKRSDFEHRIEYAIKLMK